MKHHSRLALAILVSLYFLSCSKELPDLQSSMQATLDNASNNNTKKTLPRIIKHSFYSYIYTWNFLYNKKGEVDSIYVKVNSEYYGDWQFGYKVFYSQNKIESVVRTSYGSVDARLVNIKYHGNLIVSADFYRSDNPPVQWLLEYDKNKRPLNSPIGERFYYDLNGNLVSYTHPIVPSLNSTFVSDSKENPMHRIPNLQIILLDHFQTSFYWYNPHNVVSTTYNDGRTVTVDNSYDQAGNLISGNWSDQGNIEWLFTY